MPLIKKSPGRLPEILKALTEYERTTLLNRIQVFFYLAVASLALSALPWLYIAFTGRISLPVIAIAFGISFSLWLASHVILRRAKALLCVSQYAIDNSITVDDLRRACFSGQMLVDARFEETEHVVGGNGG